MTDAWIRAVDDDWLHFTGPERTWMVTQPAEVMPALRAMETAVNQTGYWAAGWISYEAASGMDPCLETHALTSFPLMHMTLFGKVTRHTTMPHPVAGKHVIPAGKLNTGFPAYTKAIQDIKDAITRGETYQVNYTIRLNGPFDESQLPVWKALVAQAPFGAWLAADGGWIASLSPELFFQLDGDRLETRPMKGTAPRGCTVEEDQAQAKALQHCPKNRAENLMIVDMMRNDLGRVAPYGHVVVNNLFELERYPTVWQLTSAVSAQTDHSIADILAALFPSASVTGAPKRQTMRIIRRLETTPRGIYTGAIGFIGPERKAQFNVAIRTAWLDQKQATWTYGVGGGIVWDSTAESEYTECQIKTRGLSANPEPVSLLETLKRSGTGRWVLLDEHLDRLQASAAYFGIPFSRTRAMDLLREQPPGPLVARLVLHHDGRLEIVLRECVALTRPVRVAWDATPVDANDIRLYHKTTDRSRYEKARATAPDADDVLMWNKADELTESTIANVLVKLDGQWWTPPVRCGLLPGVARATLLKRGWIGERILTRPEVEHAEGLCLVNSVRGIYPALACV